MPRNAGDRYDCEKCGAVLVYEKPCPCPAQGAHGHSEICCGQQVKAVYQESATAILTAASDRFGAAGRPRHRASSDDGCSRWFTTGVALTPSMFRPKYWTD
jgi:hypothetical protein